MAEGCMSGQVLCGTSGRHRQGARHLGSGVQPIVLRAYVHPRPGAVIHFEVTNDYIFAQFTGLHSVFVFHWLASSLYDAVLFCGLFKIKLLTQHN